MISLIDTGFRPVNSNLTTESGTNFLHYLKRFNLFSEPEVLIIYPNIHFFYAENELKSVRTFIMTKKLNLIKDMDTFLQNVFENLPANVHFIGCFCDSNISKRKGFISEISNRFNNLMDSVTDRIIDKKYVSELLEKNGYKVIDMTEIDGLTFLYSQNVRHPVKITA
jgi:hypothetical protein